MDVVRLATAATALPVLAAVRHRGAAVHDGYRANRWASLRAPDDRDQLLRLFATGRSD